MRERHRHRILDRMQQLHHHIGHVPERQLPAVRRPQRRSHAERIQQQRLPTMRRRHNEVRIDAIVAQIRVARVTVTGLHFVLATERVERGARYMDASGLAARLHVIGQRHVVRPDVELPLAQPQDAAQHAAGVNADAHVQMDVRRFDDRTVNTGGGYLVAIA